MIGRTDGKHAIKNGEGYYFDKMKKWGKCKELKEQFPNLGDFMIDEIQKKEKEYEMLNEN